MFQKSSGFASASLNAQIKQEIIQHSQSLENEFKKYFLILKKCLRFFLEIHCPQW